MRKECAVDDFFLNRLGIEDLILSMSESAHIKDFATGKFIFSNEHNLKPYGFTKTEQIIGKTVHDLDSFMRPRWGKDFAKKISDLDNFVGKTGKTSSNKNGIFVSVDGILRVQDMTKIPVYNRSNNVVAIFTRVYDKTDTVDLLSLLGLYGKFYDSKNDIVKYFCKYLKIDILFFQLPTLSELLFLLYAKNYKSIPEIAENMHKCVKTCEMHVSHINNKLKEGSVKNVLNFLRAFRGVDLPLGGIRLCD